MSKPYTESDFSSQILQDRTWRIREISNIKLAVRQGDFGVQSVLLRATVAICYAHWEGAIKFAARKYLEHIALRKLNFSQLNQQFLKNFFLPRLAALSVSKTDIRDRSDLIADILSASDLQFKRVNEDLVNTKSNLSFEVFGDICLVCGVDVNNFKPWEGFIDTMLLKRRNAIAHGEGVFVQIADLDNLANETIDIIRMFGDMLENSVYQRSYRLE